MSQDVWKRVVVASRRRDILLRAKECTPEMLREAVNLTEVIRDAETYDIKQRERDVAEREAAVERFLAAWEERGEVVREVVRVRRIAGTDIDVPENSAACPLGLGNLGGYTNHGCRCAACCEASRTYQREYAALRRARAREQRAAATG